MKNCANVEHAKPCELHENCEFCKRTKCSANYAYHICSPKRLCGCGEPVATNSKLCHDCIATRKSYV